MFMVFFQGLRAYQNVVNVVDAKLIEVFAEGIIDEFLSGSRGVDEAEWHDEKLKETVMGSEGGFLFVALFYSNLVEAST